MKKKDKVEIFKNIKKCWPYFKKVKFSVIFLIFVSLFVSISNSAFPALIAKTLTFATEGKYNKAIQIGVLILAISTLINFLSELGFRFAYIKIQNVVVNSIRKDVLNSYYGINNKSLNNTPSGVFITRITEDPNTIINKLNTVRSYIQMMLSSFFVIFYLFYLHYIFGILSLVGTVIIYLIESRSSILWSNFLKRRSKLRDESNSLISESIRGIYDIKLLDLTDSFKVKIDANLDKIYEDTVKSSKVDSIHSFSRSFIMDLFMAIVIISGILFVEKKIVVIGTLTALYMYRNNMFESVLYFSWIKRELNEFVLSAERIFEVIDGKEYEKETYGNLRINDLKGNIEFKDVHFSYQKDEILKGITFNIKPKESIALVGKSGAGKTTIINLLSKMYDINSGSIKIDGYDLYDLDRYSLRKNISVIPQDPYIFNMTIKENLLIVKPEASNEEIENVLKVCELYDFVCNLPKKENTLIGENGVNLSGGEKQRLAIARALLKKSNIILFDEATSALDNETQSNIQQAINNISSYHTMIIIAHRLSTIKECDKILVLDRGKIVGFDTHKNLYKKNAIYKTLYEKELQK